MAESGKQSIRRLESQSCCLRARWQLFLLLLELAGGWAELPCLSGTSHASQSTLLRAAHRTLSVHMCLHVQACTTTASPKGCSSASSRAHTKLHGSFCQQTCKKPLRVHLWLWNPAADFSAKASGVLWGLAHFCMHGRANRDILQSCHRSLPVHPHLTRAVDETT